MIAKSIVAMTDVEGFEFYLNPGSASAEEIAELFIALSDLHKAYGGQGLRFRADGNYVFVVKAVQ